MSETRRPAGSICQPHSLEGRKGFFTPSTVLPGVRSVLAEQLAVTFLEGDFHPAEFERPKGEPRVSAVGLHIGAQVQQAFLAWVAATSSGWQVFGCGTSPRAVPVTTV